MLLNFPNALTCCNLICGCMATGAAFHGHFHWAFLMIILGAVFDFFDGMAARALHISSPIGKELDSLADVVTFGVAPSAMLFQAFGMVQYPEWLQPVQAYLPYTAFLMAAFSALRLAKFNLDERQTTSFIGLPTPANALFWSALIVGQPAYLASPRFNAVFLFLFMLMFCFLLIAEIPLFALKFKDFTWQNNRVKFIFLFGVLLILPLFLDAKTGIDPTAIAMIILWYIALSMVAWKFKLN
ncbi:MAG: CDP-diacylglycerol--serine O-phosphatidyltransferase [Bacteroidaceae bacterium]|nr:CDP-diacylglycerol--serine O-phosphatidyltransferase [Bacteroidaceae bacterium]